MRFACNIVFNFFLFQTKVLLYHRMDSIVGPLKAYLKKSDPAVIDNFSFKLHYRATFVVLLVSMMLVGALLH